MNRAASLTLAAGGALIVGGIWLFSPRVALVVLGLVAVLAGLGLIEVDR